MILPKPMPQVIFKLSFINIITLSESHYTPSLSRVISIFTHVNITSHYLFFSDTLSLASNIWTNIAIPILIKIVSKPISNIIFELSLKYISIPIGALFPLLHSPAMSLIIFPISHINIFSVNTFASTFSLTIHPFANKYIISPMHSQLSNAMRLPIFIKLSRVIMSICQLNLLIAWGILINIKREAEIVYLLMSCFFFFNIFLNSLDLFLNSIFLLLNLVFIGELSQFEIAFLCVVNMNYLQPLFSSL